MNQEPMYPQEDHEPVGGTQDPDSDEEIAGHKTHHCTDWLCLIVFAAALVPLFMIVQYAFDNGDTRKLFHGYDFLGRLCGVDVDLATNQTLGPMLYWCGDPTQPGQLDLAHPICRPSCPGENTSSSWSCYAGAERTMLPPGPDGTFEEKIVYKFAMVPDYGTTVFAARYCLPSNEEYRKQVEAALSDNVATRWILNLSGVWNAWLALLLAGIVAFVLGYAYLIILKWLARILVYISMAILCVAPLVAGVYLCSTYYGGGVDGIPSTGDAQWDLIIGISCIVLSLIFIILACCACASINTAIACVEAACDCMWDLPSLLLEPALSLTFKIFWILLMGAGFFLLVSCGDVRKVTLGQYVQAGDSTDLTGVFRTFVFNTDQIRYMFYYIFMFFWISEICTALSQFVLAYAVQLWYFTPYGDTYEKDTPACPLCRGYVKGLQYHLGTLAFGALLVAVLRLIRMILGYIAKQADKDGNPAAACAAKSCLCIITCFQRCIEFINKNAYMDVAINSTDFCTAAKNAFRFITQEFAAIGILNGATWMFQLAGVGAITGVGTWICFTVIKSFDWFTDPTSDHYVPDPVLVTVFAGIICALIAIAFMIVFDTVADTILYCFSQEQKRRQKGEFQGYDVRFAPPGLDGLIQDAGAES